jgi:hypothetical protein
MAEVSQPNLDPYARLEVGRLFGETFGVFFRNFLPLMVILVLLSLPTTVWTLVYLSNLTLDDLAAQASGMTAHQLASSLLALVLQSIASGAAIYAVARYLKTRAQAPIGRSIGVGVALFPKLLAVGALLGVPALLLGQILLMMISAGEPLGWVLLLVAVPVGVALWVAFSVAVPAILLERVGPIVALRRSWQLTGGQRWRIFGLMSLLGCVYLGVAVVFTAFAFMGGALQDPVLLAKAQAGSSLILQPLGGGLGAALITLVFRDLRTLKEGIAPDELATIFE